MRRSVAAELIQTKFCPSTPCAECGRRDLVQGFWRVEVRNLASPICFSIIAYCSPALLLHIFVWLVAWHSGRTSVFGRRTFPVLRSTCSWWVTTYVGKPSVTGQPTRPTQPFILSRSINWVVSCNRMPASSHERRHLVNAYGVNAWCGWLER